MAHQDQFSSGKESGSRFPNAESAKAKAGELKEEAKHRGKQQAETGKQQAAHQAENLAETAERVSADLRRDLPRVADYTDEIAGSIRQLADQLRQRSIDDLLADTQELARRNPALFFLGSAAIGVALSRFFKASSEPEDKSTALAETPTWEANPQPVSQPEPVAPESTTQRPEGSGLT